MNTVRFDLSRNDGQFKILNATNGGPWHKRHVYDQVRSNFEDYKAARIPFSRNHDSADCAIYGGPYSHDITCIFPCFDADPYDPASYDFACTDEAILVCLDAGTQTFFRLGQTIEHQIKKHGTLPPEDFHKWAVICEHIIRHYNEGWADGFHLNMQYWEIWNEPDLDPDDSQNKRTWGGTKAQFFDLFEIAARHLKKCFPNLKIGGPAVSGRIDWTEDFLRAMSQRKVPMDFFSWHIYCVEPAQMAQAARRINDLLHRYGYGHAEKILNEWNYVKGWTEAFVESIEAIHGIKGAAFTMACISQMQHEPVDMLMYYDTRPSSFNGAFDFYTWQKLKGYYPLYWYGMMYDMVREIKAEEQPQQLYSLCGVDAQGKATAIITYYSDDDGSADKTITVDFGKQSRWQVYLLDDRHNGELVETTEQLTFEMKVQSVLLLKEI